jgi:hypothetical protein
LILKRIRGLLFMISVCPVIVLTYSMKLRKQFPNPQVVAEGKLPRATSQKLWQSVREQGNWYLG